MGEIDVEITKLNIVCKKGREESKRRKMEVDHMRREKQWLREEEKYTTKKKKKKKNPIILLYIYIYVCIIFRSFGLPDSPYAEFESSQKYHDKFKAKLDEAREILQKSATKINKKAIGL
jgi:hypothetical protein